MHATQIQTSDGGHIAFDNQTDRAPSLATRAWNESDQTLEDATDILFDCVVDDKEFLAEKMPQILRAWCYEQISSHVSRIRLASWTAPNYQKQSKTERIRLAFSDKLMDFPLIGGKRLGDASKDEVQASAASYLEQANTLAHRGRWLNAVAKKLNANTTVSQALTEAELRELQEKTNAS